MRKISLLLLTLLSFQTFAQNMDERGYIVSKGEKTPSFELQLLSGETITNEMLLGKVVVLQFTASWCSVCRKEMPHLESDVWQQFKEDDFLLVGIDLKEDEATTRAFIKTIGTTYPIALDLDGSLFALFAGPKQGVTRNIVIDKKGVISYLTRLYEREEFEEMITVIETELEK
jgi:peroxiredoxin|tara:strand:- start:1546 stop:2064 length:519 start_codon:yes stop_codon:yes gene_type:complete